MITAGNRSSRRRFGSVARLVGIATALSATPRALADDRAPSREVKIAPSSFRVVERESGPVNYYSVVTSGPMPFIHAAYSSPLETTVLGYQVPDGMRRSIARLRWQWRALKLPVGGDECVSEKADSAAVVYVTWKRALRWYSLKYVWSAVGTKGAVCDARRNPFLAQDTMIVESGPPLGEWRSFSIDPDDEFRRHFEGGDARAEVPPLVGIGLMSDGDQTASESQADYADFAILPK